MRRILPLASLALACVGEGVFVDGKDQPLPKDVPTVSEDSPVHLVGADRPRGIYMVAPKTEAPSLDEERFGTLSVQRRIIFMNKNGGTYTPGGNDSSRNISSIPSRTSTVPAYEKGEASWQQVMTCVRSQFARFNVEVTDVDPGTAPHIECVMGGSPRNVGMQDGVGGVAPMWPDCSTVERAVVYVFTRVFSSPRVECEVAAQEIAHAIGLDHEYLCQDPMTYLSGCGEKNFVDQAVSCGEYSPRQCMCGGSRQNSVQFMLQRLGPATPTPPPPPPDGGTPPPPPPPTGDTTPPTVTIVSPADGTTLPANSRVSIVAEATDNVGVTKIELFWAFNNRTLPCDNSVSGVTCTTEGNKRTWSFQVGKGNRTFEVRAYDAAGNRTATPARSIYMSDGSTPTPPPPTDPNQPTPPPPSPPTPPNPPTPPPPPPPQPGDPKVTILSPASGAQLAPGAIVDLSVRVEGAAVARVDVLWQAPTEARLFQLTQVSTGQYALRVQLGQNAAVGPRALTVTALTESGATGTSSVMVTVGQGGGGTQPPTVPGPAPGG